jgi:two-component system sensor histidine kinase KdpD
MTQGQNPTLVMPGEFTAKALMLGLRPVGALGWRPARFRGGGHGGQRAGGHRAHPRHGDRGFGAHGGGSRGERLRTALIDSLTHELRTPLTAIRAAATTLLEA